MIRIDWLNWHRSDAVNEPERGESSRSSEETEENRIGQQSRATPIRTTAVRTTAPNIRRMIDKYHQKMTGTGAAKEKPALSLNLNIRTKLPTPSDRSLPPSPLLIVEDKCPTPPVPDVIQQRGNTPQPSLLQPNRIWVLVISLITQYQIVFNQKKMSFYFYWPFLHRYKL